MKAAHNLDHKHNVTAKMIEPILDIYAAEGAPFMSSFKNVTPWVVEAQKYVIGDLMEMENHNFNVIDSYEAFSPPSGNFSHAKPTIVEKIDATEIYSYSHQAYNWRTNPKIDAADFYAASEVGAKLKSRQAIYDHFNMNITTENVTESTCQEINEYAQKWFRENWSGDPKVIEQYDQIGQPLEFIEDTNSPSGILWVNEGLIYKNTTESFQVSSRELLSDIDFMVPKAAGMLYCKLMSPARIMEWILVDGLKKNFYWVPRDGEGEVESEESLQFLQ